MDAAERITKALQGKPEGASADGVRAYVSVDADDLVALCGQPGADEDKRVAVLRDGASKVPGKRVAILADDARYLLSKRRTPVAAPAPESARSPDLPPRADPRPRQE